MGASLEEYLCYAYGMAEWIALILSGSLLFADSYFNFLPKLLIAGLLVVMVTSLLHITIKDAVKDAIVETEENKDARSRFRLWT